MTRTRAAAAGAAFAVALVVVAEPFGIIPATARTAATLMLVTVTGYGVGLTLVPDGMTAGGRLILSLGAALAVPVVSALVLTLTPWGIGRWQFVISIVILMAVALGIGLRRHPETWRGGWNLPPLDRRFAIGAVVYSVAFAGSVTAVSIRVEAASQPAVDITELSLDPLALDEGRVVVHVVSREHRLVQFRLDVAVDGTPRLSRTQTVANDEEWSIEIPGDFAGTRVVVTLQREPDIGPPYRTVSVTMPLRAASGEASP